MTKMVENERNFIAFVIALVCLIESNSKKRRYRKEIDIECMFLYLSQKSIFI